MGMIDVIVELPLSTVAEDDLHVRVVDARGVAVLDVPVDPYYGAAIKEVNRFHGGPFDYEVDIEADADGFKWDAKRVNCEPVWNKFGEQIGWRNTRTRMVVKGPAWADEQVEE